MAVVVIKLTGVQTILNCDVMCLVIKPCRYHVADRASGSGEVYLANVVTCAVVSVHVLCLALLSLSDYQAAASAAHCRGSVDAESGARRSDTVDRHHDDHVSLSTACTSTH